jgi:hypothetical protein
MTNNNPNNQPIPYNTSPFPPLNIPSTLPNPVPATNHEIYLPPDHHFYSSPVSGYSFLPQHVGSLFPSLPQHEGEQLNIPIETKPPVQENVIPNVVEVSAVLDDHNESNFNDQPAVGSIEELKNIANYSVKSGKYAESIEQHKKLLEANPKDGYTWTALGHCYLLEEKYQEAFNAYQRALYVLPDVKQPQLWYGIGLLYEKVSTQITIV